jgi:hypothetical protein
LNRLHAFSQRITESREEMVPHFWVDRYKELPSRYLTQEYTELHNRYGSRDVIRVNKSSRLIRSGNVAQFRKTTNGYKKPERKYRVGDLGSTRQHRPNINIVLIK